MSSWKLRKDVAEDTQGLIASGFGRLEHGMALFLETQPRSGGGWLKALQDALPATAAIETGGELLPFAASFAFTASGMRNLGLSDEELGSFSDPFREGMMQEDRLRRLGDRRRSEWLDTVIEGGPVWSGNVQPEAVEDNHADDATPVQTTTTVHALVLLYAQERKSVEAKTEEIEQLLISHDVSIVHRLALVLDVEEGRNISREHFGFADGISQPIPFDEPRPNSTETSAVEIDGNPAVEPDRVHGVRLGEILLGHVNGHQEIPPGPIVRDSADNPLPEQNEAIGFRDLGRNGSYMIVRQLHQDVAAFWNSMEEAANTLCTQNPTAENVDAKWVAEKVVGRGIDGRGLRPNGRIPDVDGEADNGFLYFDEDRHGTGCPLGSHVRRSNPRDSLAPKEDMKQTLLDAANNHRILRRTRKYGAKFDRKQKDDGQERGLLFICLNTDIARQFEFTQQTWLMNSDFSTLYEESDPLIGPDGEMTIPAEPLRYRAKVKTFVKLVGGEYFFMPSMSGLRYLAGL